MALLLIEGFDHESAAAMGQKQWSGGNPTTMQPGRFDGQAARFTNVSTNNFSKSFSAHATLIAGFAVRGTTLMSAGGNVFQMLAGGTVVASIVSTVAGFFAVQNSGGSTIGTGTTVIANNSWHYLELKIFVNGASGTCELHMDGAVEIASTVGNFGSSNPDTIRLKGDRSGSGNSVDFDDIYVLDTTGSAPRNTFLGDVRVETIYPTSDGAHSQWTPNSGSTHWTQVSETPQDGDTTYVSDLTPNDLDTYGCSDIDTGATVYGVQVNLEARKDDASTRQIAPVIRQAGTDNVGTTVTLASTYGFFTQIYNQDPTGADWTATNVNADEFGIKEIA